MAVRILYPCYFDASLTRAQGRRVVQELAVQQPNTAQLVRAAKAAGLPIIEEELKASHPAQWFAGGGRVRIEFSGSKEELLKIIAEKLRRK